jgi:chemotaxis signal transduction protein
VSEVLDIPAGFLESPDQGPAWMRSELISALGKMPGRLLVILNPERLLSPQEERLLPGPVEGGEGTEPVA